MTVIVYRDGVMAADMLVTCGTARVAYGLKIARGPDGALGAAAGSPCAAKRFRDWIAGGRRGAFDPDPGRGGFDALIVEPDGLVSQMGEGGVAIPYPGLSFVAEGQGWEVAVGAMEMGADAEQAVAAAIKHVTSCGGPIQVERLGDAPARLQRPARGRASGLGDAGAVRHRRGRGPG